MTPPPRVHDYPVPIPTWWIEAVRRELAKRTRADGEPWEWKDLASAAGLERYEVSKVIHGRGMLAQVKKISDALALPRPVAVFDTEELAMVWERELRLRGLRAQVDAVSASVPPRARTTRR